MASPVALQPDGYLMRADGFLDPVGPPGIPSPLGTSTSLVERFYAVADAFPDAVAIDDGAASLTYAAMGRHVARFAHQLSMQPPGPVAVVSYNSLAFPPLMMALLASGRPFTPIDASHPLDRQAGVFDQLRPALVVTTAPVAADLSFVPDIVPVLHMTLDDGAPTPQRPDPAAIDPDFPCALVFTSGSTGRPKGVVGSQRGYLNTLREYVQSCSVTRDDVILSIASLSAVGAREILAALMTGASVRLVDFKSQGLVGALQGLAGATILSFAPSIMRTVLGLPGVEQYTQRLRVLSLLGEPVLASDVRLFREKLSPDCRICIEFGTTETTSVFRWFVRDDAVEGASTPAGYLAPGYRIMLVDEAGHPVASGETGELVVSSVSVAKGLWIAGELTPGPFIADSSDPAVRSYATGDLMRMRPDGLFEALGRRDRMVKVRGLQVDLAEVETVLLEAPGISDAVAIAIQRPGLAPELVAFVSGDGDIDSDALRRNARLRLAEHMTPSRILQLDAIPRLPNFKPDLVALEKQA